MARKWWTLTAVVAGMFMLLMDVTIVNVALPQIQKAFPGQRHRRRLQSADRRCARDVMILAPADHKESR
jgi:hypothetical protein